MKSILIASITFMSLTGCSLYKSNGRKEFESDAPGKLKTSSVFQLKSCKTQGSIESWFNEEFPAATYELVVAENDLEIWRTNHEGVVEVKAIQKIDSTASGIQPTDSSNTVTGQTQTCIYEFANMATWDLYKDQFIRELENNLLTAE